MEDPTTEIAPLILSLCTSTPSHQRRTLEESFLPNASFTHPFCRTGSFQGSRWLIWQIYRWYKIMSPRIDMVIDSVAWDREPTIRGATYGGKLKAEKKYVDGTDPRVDGGEDGGILYVGIRQKFRIWFVPFFGAADVRFVTVLHLEKRTAPLSIREGEGRRSALTNGYDDEGRPSRSKTLYYIKSQNDLYQVNEFFKFFDRAGVLGLLVLVWQLAATLMCALLALLFWPVSWVEERVIGGNQQRGLIDVVKD